MSRPRLLGLGLVLLSVVAITAKARAQGTNDGSLAVAPSGMGFECKVSALRLEEVIARGGGAEAFAARWSGLLQQVARCAATRSMRDACIAVQGRYAALDFVWGDQNPAAAAGAQATRADARAIAVRTKLQELGVEQSRIVSWSTPPTGSFEGVMVSLTRDCGAASKQAGGDERAQTGPWAELGLAGSGLWRGPRDVLSGGLRVGLGFHAHHVYARLDGGFWLGSSRTQRGAFGLGTGLGIELASFVQLGVTFAYRQGADRVFASWLERVWSIGVESRQCRELGESAWSVCLREGLLPFGQQELRGRVVGGEVYRVPAQRGSAVRADVGLSLTRGF